MCSICALSNVHGLLGWVQKANHSQEKSFEMLRVIRERTSVALRDIIANDEVTEMWISREEDWDDPKGLSIYLEWQISQWDHLA